LISGSAGFSPGDHYFTNDGHAYGDYAVIGVEDEAKEKSFEAKRRFKNQPGFGRDHVVWLFDLDDDEKEKHNLANTKPDIVNSMLETLWEKYGDPRNGYQHPQATLANIAASFGATPDGDGYWIPTGEKCHAEGV